MALLKPDWKLNFPEKTTQPDIAYAVHKCRYEHGKAIKQIGRYLIGTKNKGIKCTPSDTGLECYADVDFAGNWDKHLAPDDNSTARSCTGYLIKYAGMPITWASRVQTEGAHILTESKYILLSTM
jgi:hypothetical protein